MNIDMSHVRMIAERELRDEIQRSAVDREKQRIRSRTNQSLWQRLFNWLPFTITIERKKT